VNIKEKDMKNQPTKTIIHPASIGSRNGYSFLIYWNNRTYPNFTGALYTTEEKARQAMDSYLATGKIEFYGDAG
jgi:hypothetical protein